MVARGCGASRQLGAVYFETHLSSHGLPIEEFLVDPPIPVDTQELGITPIGVKLVERNGIWHVMDWVGSTHYKNVADYFEECLIPGELIISKSGLKAIESLTTDDEVLSHRGNFKKVQETSFRNYSGELISIQSSYWNQPLRLTPEHPVYRAKVLRGRERLKKKGIGGEEILEQGFIPAKDLCLDDYMCFPLYRHVKDVDVVEMQISTTYPLVHGNRKINREDITKLRVKEANNTKVMSYRKIAAILGISPSAAMRATRLPEVKKRVKEVAANNHLLSLCGYYLSEGSVANPTGNGKSNCWYVTEFSFGLENDLDEKRFAENVKQHADSLGFSSGITIKDGCWHVLVYSRYLAHFMADNFGHGAKNKKIPDWVLSLPPEKQKWLLYAEIDGDGHFKKEQIEISTASVSLAHGIRLIAHRLGYRASINRYDSKKGTIYKVSLYTNTGTDVFVKDGYIYLPVSSIDRIGYVGPVYNIAVEDDESYCTMYHTVHNCRRFGLSRRASTGLDFKKLTPQSRILLLHSNAYIYNYHDYKDKEPTVEELEGLVPYPECPKHLGVHERPRMDTMCARLWYQDIVGGEGVEASVDEMSASRIRLVTRKMPSFEYHGLVKPSDVKPKYKVAIFASFPIHNLAVVKDNEAGTHTRSLMLAEEARIPVKLVDE